MQSRWARRLVLSMSTSFPRDPWIQDEQMLDSFVKNKINAMGRTIGMADLIPRAMSGLKIVRPFSVAGIHCFHPGHGSILQMRTARL